MDGDRLFNSSNPLEERLGSKFFEVLPKQPGIYKMFGRKGVLLYVGKAKNLRTRLFTYRRIRSDTGSRKTRRLVRLIRTISIEIHPDEQAALLRENELIRRHKPPFNRAKKVPETYYFISAVPVGGCLVFDLRMHLREDQRSCTFGAFKGHRTIRRALGALLRQLYIMQEGIDSPFLLPGGLLNRLTPLHYELEVDKNTAAAVHEYLGGVSDDMLFRIIEHARSRNLLEQFIGKLILRDMESMQWFYRRCALRNREMVRRLQLDSHIIPQEKLDDYLVRLNFDKSGR